MINWNANSTVNAFANTYSNTGNLSSYSTANKNIATTETKLPLIPTSASRPLTGVVYPRYF